MRVGQQADLHFLIEDVMGNGIFFAFLPALENFLRLSGSSKTAAIFFAVKIPRTDDTVIDQGQHEAVGQIGAQLFHQIQGQTAAAGTISMQKARLDV